MALLWGRLAERVGFEPTVELPRQQFSRLPDSAALAPLRSWAVPKLRLDVCGDGFSEFDWASLPWGREIFNWFSFHAEYRYHSAW